ncbi:MAG: hypothetical protein OEZ25_08445 [Candidatus Bathyarchaeota archaeon]|nr:hypothetical protein [Candidatus Bathyarchaeota archaeon]
MKTKVITAIMLPVFLASILGMVSVTSVVAKERPVIAEVERTDKFYLLIMCGHYPQGFQFGENYYPDLKGALSPSYRNLSPDLQWIKITVPKEAELAFLGWPEWRAVNHTWLLQEEPDGRKSIIYPIWPDAWVKGTAWYDFWFVGRWNAGEKVHVKLELVEPYSELLYEGTLTIPPVQP